MYDRVWYERTYASICFFTPTILDKATVPIPEGLPLEREKVPDVM